MGTFDALRTYRRQVASTPMLGEDKIVGLARSLVADTTGLDFVAAIEIHPKILATAPLEPPQVFYRHCIFDLVIAQKMVWGRVVTLGRRRFYDTLERDERACFRAAQLMNDPPAPDIVEWWDSLELAMRAASDADKKVRSRLAEKLTYDYEIAELARLGISRQPKWMAVDDNTAGYDVLSFRPGQFGPVNLLIEVKSTIASPLRFFVTRNEWEQAVKFGETYIFHVWDLATHPPRLYVRTKREIAPHIPTDQSKGKWVNAEIPLAVS